MPSLAFRKLKGAIGGSLALVTTWLNNFINDFDWSHPGNPATDSKARLTGTFNPAKNWVCISRGVHITIWKEEDVN